ncbi:MAG: alpha/beta fold hydrolase [Thermodesulfobacteriota bacterium]
MTTLVLFHGWGATGEAWRSQADYFKDRGTVLTPTIPVWGVDWLSDYLRELPLPNCVLVGWSLGGMLLLEALRELRDSPIGGLVLVGVAPVFCQRPDYPWGQPPALVRTMRRGVKGYPRQVLDEFARLCLAPGEAAYSSMAQAVFASPADSGTLTAGLDYLLTCDLRPLLPGLPKGAVIIQGQEDRIVPPAQGRFLREKLGGARSYELPGAGHLPFLTQPAAVNGIIEECLNKTI